VDFDKSGTLSKREFMLFVMRNTKHSEAVVLKLFESMDADKNGYITREEIRRAYRK
jgi:Ca2+-binding EF-hand superfamily protein